MPAAKRRHGKEMCFRLPTLSCFLKAGCTFICLRGNAARAELPQAPFLRLVRTMWTHYATRVLPGPCISRLRCYAESRHPSSSRVANLSIDRKEGPMACDRFMRSSELLKPSDARLMRCFPVSTRINHVVNDDEECSRPIEIVETQDSLFS